MIEKFVLNNVRIKMMKLKYNNKSYRLFIPDINDIIYNPNLVKNLKKYNYDDASLFYIQMFIDYFTLNSTHLKQAYPHPVYKSQRLFNKREIVSSEIFNKDLEYKKYKDVKNYLKLLTLEKGEEKKYNKIISQLENEDLYKAIDFSFDELIKRAFKKDEPEDPFIDDIGFAKTFYLEMEKVFNVSLYFSNKINPNDINEKDVDYVNNIFKEDQLKKILFDDADIQNLIIQIQNSAIEIKRINKKFFQKEIDKDTFSIALMALENEDKLILSLLENKLRKINSTRRTKVLKERLNILINNVKTFQSNDISQGIINLHNYFIKYEIINEYILFKIEGLFRKLIRISNKEILRQLINEYDLNKEEIRLFIVNNIGIKKFNFICPTFEKGLYYFFNYKKIIYPCFFENVILKINKLYPQGESVVDLTFLLNSNFKMYLEVYSTFLESQKIIDKDKKAINTFNNKIKYLENEEVYFNSTKPRNLEELDKIPLQFNNSEKLFEEKNIEDNELSEIIEHLLEVKPKNVIKFIKREDENLKEFELNDILSTYLNDEEKQIIQKNIIQGFTLEEIAFEKNISFQAISKKKIKAINKLDFEKIKSLLS